MSKIAKNAALIAEWAFDQDPSADPPNAVRWANGSPATYNDYLTHMVDTHTWVGGELRMFPDIIADVNYNHSARVWVVSGDGITSVALDLTDPHAPDDQIIAELYTCPIVFRARIHR